MCEYLCGRVLAESSSSNSGSSGSSSSSSSDYGGPTLEWAVSEHGHSALLFRFLFFCDCNCD
jgi:hypothetical protein